MTCHGRTIFPAHGDEYLEVTYWIGKPYWGKGIATGALSAFLEHSKVRPLYARAAKDNIGSLRVLEKCGFTRIGEGSGFSEARGEEVETAFPALLHSMKHPLAQQGKASSAIHYSLDEFQFGHLPFNHSVVDRPG